MVLKVEMITDWMKFRLGRDGRDGMPGSPGPAGNTHLAFNSI